VKGGTPRASRKVASPSGHRLRPVSRVSYQASRLESPFMNIRRMLFSRFKDGPEIPKPLGCPIGAGPGWLASPLQAGPEPYMGFSWIVWSNTSSSFVLSKTISFRVKPTTS